MSAPKAPQGVAIPDADASDPAMDAGGHRFASLVRHSPGLLGLSVATAIVSAALSVAPFWLIYRMAVEWCGPAPDLASVRMLAGWTLAALALRWAAMAASHVLAHRGAFSIQHRLRLALARKLGQVPLSFFAARGRGGLRRVLTDDVNGLEGFLAHMLPDAVAAAVVPLAALAVLFAVDWRLALAAVAPLPAALAAQAVLMRRAASGAGRWSALQREIADQVGEYVRGVQVVKSFGLEARSFSRLAAAIHGSADWVAQYARASARGWLVYVGLLSSNLLLVAPLGVWLHARGALDIPTLFLFLLLAPAVLQPLLRLTFVLGGQSQRAQALAHINAVLAEPALAQTPGATAPAGALSIEYDSVSHRYGDRLALDGVSFRAGAGRLTALVGASGSGKSTLARLLPRLYDASAGQVRVGGRDVRDWPLDALLAQVSVVFQDVFLFHGTIADNLRLARADASAGQLESAARAASAHDFIMALPHGYQTVIGERGARLSGGERQRLSIARALLKDAPVLLLDEATSSIDAENEDLVQDALSRLCRGRTVLMIAHRLHTVMQADHIVVMARGRVVGQGTHECLLAGCAAYRELWRDHEDALDWRLGAQGEQA
ncbi:Iron import ATP-binding/permease protein IrtA [Achromobacter sp. 2789STDY5608615]|uniref:ABC transporter ATP-binding protein n=1 Tax=Achromobacter sp. 2789STDY5608615 TaxID=1806492 RepID=UPI0006BEC96B|nr:ABC transporter ATP-binding protein [Achromobacter sp. 2789STDY5608615]CUJ95221.1 Iron import ATP-binding/permease protein IrtA [Achromobacter sp. 2789STDY5608615]